MNFFISWKFSKSNLFTIEYGAASCFFTLEQGRIHLPQDVCSVSSKSIDSSYLQDWLWVNFDNLIRSLKHGDGQASLDRATYAYYEGKALIFYLLAVVFTVRFVEKEYMRAQSLSANIAILIFRFGWIRNKMM